MSILALTAGKRRFGCDVVIVGAFGPSVDCVASPVVGLFDGLPLSVLVGILLELYVGSLAQLIFGVTIVCLPSKPTLILGLDWLA